MSTIEQSVDVEVPVRIAYDQWTQFETFPEFMEGVESVSQVDPTHLHWIAKIAGIHREWDAEIIDQSPDQRVAWRTTSGAKNDGAVTFQRIDDTHSKVMLQIEFEPEGMVEKAGDMLGIVSARTKGDLERFKGFIEQRGSATGSWRGEVDQSGGEGLGAS